MASILIVVKIEMCAWRFLDYDYALTVMDIFPEFYLQNEYGDVMLIFIELELRSFS